MGIVLLGFFFTSSKVVNLPVFQALSIGKILVLIGTLSQSSRLAHDVNADSACCDTTCHSFSLPLSSIRDGLTSEPKLLRSLIACRSNPMSVVANNEFVKSAIEHRKIAQVKTIEVETVVYVQQSGVDEVIKGFAEGIGAFRLDIDPQSLNPCVTDRGTLDEWPLNAA